MDEVRHTPEYRLLSGNMTKALTRADNESRTASSGSSGFVWRVGGWEGMREGNGEREMERVEEAEREQWMTCRVLLLSQSRS